MQCGCKKTQTALIDGWLTSKIKRIVAAVVFVLKICDEVFVGRTSLSRVTGFCAIREVIQLPRNINAFYVKKSKGWGVSLAAWVRGARSPPSSRVGVPAPVKSVPLRP